MPDPEEQATLESLTRKGTAAARKLTRALALLLCGLGEGGFGWKDADVAEALGATTTRSSKSWRKRAYEEESLESLSPRAYVRNAEPLLDVGADAAVVKLTCSAPPEGRSRWSLERVVNSRRAGCR
ncbi:hypothetical protein [Alienimonas chondri]|uniref:Helix-turn-helix domain-containing protein n=1 Tax=Alienimonas chondri TaxID=2681879 RepID=A0ABX1VB41_9PLAN|nr:hypothetical protein [Alienimonas chondri]NNJ24651.1 hypothetical protein [Alienimonas chondri]